MSGSFRVARPLGRLGILLVLGVVALVSSGCFLIGVRLFNASGDAVYVGLVRNPLPSVQGITTDVEVKFYDGDTLLGSTTVRVCTRTLQTDDASAVAPFKAILDGKPTADRVETRTLYRLPLGKKIIPEMQINNLDAVLSGSEFVISGTILNDDAQTFEDVNICIVTLDDAGNVLDLYTDPPSPSTLDPNEDGNFEIDIPRDTNAKRYKIWVDAIDEDGEPTRYVTTTERGLPSSGPTATRTNTVVGTPTRTRTPSPTAVIGGLPTATPTRTNTATATATNTPVPPTSTATSTPVPPSTATNTATSTATLSPTPTATDTPVVATSTFTATATNTFTPSATATETPVGPTSTPTPTNTRTSTPTSTNTPIGGGPANDNVDNAHNTAPLPFTDSLDNGNATLEDGETRPCGLIDNTVWYRFDVPAGASLQLAADTEGSDFDTVLAVYTNAFVSPPDGLDVVGCDDDGGTGALSRLEFTAFAGLTYWFQVGGKDGATGNLVFNLTQVPGGAISGTVTDSVGEPIEGALVTAECDNCPVFTDTFTGPDGTYSFDNLLPGSYRIFGDAPGYVGEWYDDKLDFDLATLVQVTGGSSTPGINFSLDVGGNISGTITSSVDGMPIEGAFVGVECDDCDEFEGAVTDASGNYTASGLQPGNYRVSAFFDGFAGEYYDGTYSFSSATLVPVSGTANVIDIDIKLDPGAEIHGRVMANGAPVADAAVFAQREVCCAFGFASTDSDGFYQLRNLPPGDYTVEVDADGWAPQYYDGVYSLFAATLVPASSGAVTAGIDFDLEAPGTISGIVTDEFGVPIGGANVFASCDLCSGFGFGVTAADGTYVVGDLPPGTYRVDAGAAGYAGEYFDDTYSFSDATLVAVALGIDTPNINFELAVEGRIAGTVTDENGAPVANAFVSASCDDCPSSGFAITNSAGEYTIEGLIGAGDLPAYYRVFVERDGFAPEYYENAYEFIDATLVAVDFGATTQPIDIEVGPGGTISGTVFDNEEHPIPNATVIASCVFCSGFGEVTTDANGNYTIGDLIPGDYVVSAEAAGFATEYWIEAANFADAVPVFTSPATPVIDVDFTLVPAARIAGKVTDELGEPIEGAGISASCNNCGDFGFAISQPDGTYLIGDLTPGQYTVEVHANGYAPEYWDNTYDIGAATPVFAFSGQTQLNINFALAVEGTISGKVVDINGYPIPGALMDAEGAVCCNFGSSFTASDGTYVISGLAPGNYTVAANVDGYVFEYYDGVTDIDDATAVVVTSGADTPNIDFEIGPFDPDFMSTPLRVFDLPYTHALDTAAATLEVDEPQPSCGAVDATVWYRLDSPESPPFEGDITIDTIGSGFDTVIAVYEFSAFTSPAGGADEVACNSGDFPPDSSVTFTAQPGFTYLIQVGAATPPGGSLTVNLSCPDCGGP